MTKVDRNAIVTGASKGIGAAIAKRLAADGFRLIVNYASSKSEADRIVSEIETAGGHAMAVRADISQADGVRALFDAAESAYGRVDVLVNNAGIARQGLLADVSDTDYDRQIEINLNGSFYGMREAARRIADGGRIINLSTSIVGTYVPTYGVYAASKAAVEAMTRVLAKELGQRGITVNAVAPGPVATDLFLTGRSEEFLKQAIAAIPLGRLGEVEDIARVVSFLAGPDGSWVSGQIIRANGGRN